MLESNKNNCAIILQLKIIAIYLQSNNLSRGANCITPADIFMKIKFDVYRDSRGVLSLEKKEYSYENQDWELFLKETGQNDRCERLLSMSSRKRSPKVWKLRKSDSFKEWSKNNIVQVSSSLYGVVSCEYDGRLREYAIKYAVLDALKFGEKEARVYPESNKNKPAHLHMVYVFTFDFVKV